MNELWFEQAFHLLTKSLQNSLSVTTNSLITFSRCSRFFLLKKKGSMLEAEGDDGLIRGGTGQDICGPNQYRVIQAEALH